MAIAARNQPQGLVRLNRSNPLTRGAQAIVSASSNFNAATAKPLTVAGSGYAKLATPGGIAAKFRKNFYLDTGTAAPAIGTQTFVEFWYGYPSSDLSMAGGTSEPGFLTGSDTNKIGIAGFIGSSRLGANAAQWGAVYDFGTVNSSGEVLTPGKLTTLVVIRRQAGMEFWRDGLLVNTIAQSPISYPACSFILGSFIRDTSFWTSNSDTILAGRIVNDWSSADVKSFCRNPWQLFDAPSQSQFPMVAAAGGTGATATPSGVSASSAVGSATATGQAKAAPAGVSATASVGTATATGSAAVNGTASPAGVATASAVGTSAATGGAGAQPVGISATSAVGTATSTGSAFAAPAGVSALASVGNAVASGPVSATAFPAGVSAIASVGAAVFSQPSTGDGANFRGGNWRGWDEKAWRKRKGLPEIAEEVRTAWEGMKAAPAAVVADVPAAIKPVIKAEIIQPQALDLSEVKALMRAWEAEQARRDDEEEDDLLTLLAL